MNSLQIHFTQVGGPITLHSGTTRTGAFVDTPEEKKNVWFSFPAVGIMYISRHLS